VREAVLEAALGAGQGVHDASFRLHRGEIASPRRTARGRPHGICASRIRSRPAAWRAASRCAESPTLRPGPRDAIEAGLGFCDRRP
jgi:hypothetical protein